MINKTICLVFMVLLLTVTACALAVDSNLQPSEIHSPTLVSDTSKTISFPRQDKTNGLPWIHYQVAPWFWRITLRLKVNDSETSYMLIWPPDFSLMDENGTIKVLNENKKIDEHFTFSI